MHLRKSAAVLRYVEQEFEAYLQCGCPECGSFESGVRVVVVSNCWRLAASAEYSARVAVRVEWLKVQLCG